jgi:heme O synthase-like polyprenyltransferase
MGAGFLAMARQGFSGTGGGAWARRAMLYSIVWLTAVMVSLVAFAR